ncbi:MAG: hemD [Ilumatobacteraceae bacterium]|nr:hemD [Ilumatobacteraceae bacterium]
MTGPSGDAAGRLRLAGRTIVVTRAAAQAGPLVERLHALGAEAIVVPLIEITEPSDGGAALAIELAALDTYHWLVVTSPNGAERVRDALAAAPPTVRVAAVGTATAAALGRAPDLVPAVQTAVGLAAELPAGPGRVLVAQAEDAEPTLAAAATEKGWEVHVAAAYRTVAVVPDAALTASVMAADAVLFASGSAVRSWVASFGTATPSVVAVIGPATADVARDTALKVHVVATDNSLDGLVVAVAEFLEKD